ncbi:hypothetical protein K458DRAFT_292866 [Lentithecium fluviatile CBS 122367]|uniref:Capsule polysaccharide biosynthesis protein n=1 Tax=Lentithecium fluviatile CBS 122367 TaxID=1168545 RepID=A0A6G1JDM8_9PLEO|nr:hypothetical protein K458DRAFT_292866 [Lentithecium fluviatile CBS 122367]
MSRAVKLAAAGASLAALASQPAFRALVTKWSGIGAPGGVWRLVAILFALTNLKKLPFVWHFRFFRAYIYHIYLQPTPIPPTSLFHPVITSTRSPLLEMDYNLHKSNSTYFSDMDMSRTHLFCAVIRRAIHKTGQAMPASSSNTGGQYMIALGGLACNFKREILPYAKYEMWTRILCWDRKWFYLLTWLVKPGVGRPPRFTLQPWRKPKAGEISPEKLKGAIYATAVAKYVIKKDRITIPAEQVLVDAEMVPVKPEGWVYRGDEGGAVDDADAVLPQKHGEEGEWNWEVIERERRRGLRFAEAFAELDGLHDVFDGGKEGALGEYADLLWR